MLLIPQVSKFLGRSGSRGGVPSGNEVQRGAWIRENVGILGPGPTARLRRKTLTRLRRSDAWLAMTGSEWWVCDPRR